MVRRTISLSTRERGEAIARHRITILGGAFVPDADRVPDHATFGAHELADPTEHDALVHECRDRHVPAVTHVPDALSVRDARLGEEDLVEFGFSRHLAERPHLHARLVHVDVEVRQAAVLRNVRIGPGQEQAPTRDVGHARPHLLPVDHPFVAVTHRRRRERRNVGPGAGFAEHLAPDLLAREVGPQEPALLLLGTERDEGGPRHAHAHHVAQEVLRGLGGHEALVDEVLEAGVDAEPPLPLGEMDPGEAEIELGAPEVGVRLPPVLREQTFGPRFDLLRDRLT